MVRRNTLIAAALLAAALDLSGQNAPVPKESSVLPAPAPEERIFAPFPLRIRIGTRPDGVLLTWEESSDPISGYSVFRSESPIDRGTFPEALRLTDLPAGTFEYLDVPPDSRGYYYAVLGRTEQGGVYEVFIPLKNVSIAPVSYVPPAAPEPEPEPEPTPAEPAPEPPPAVLASSERDGIRVTWEPVRPGRRVVLYRSPTPIRSLSDLLTASWVASAEESPEGILDFPVPGIGYYYALVDDEGLRAGSPELAVGRNVTAESVSVPAGRFRIGLPEIPYASRSLPLPYLSLTRGVEAGSEALPGGLPVPPASPLRPETQKAVSRLSGNAKNPPANPPGLRILPEDQESSAVGGEEYTLRTIVRDRLARKDWKGASDELARYLSLNRSPVAAARARFYRGQALAYSGQYREAFFEFLLAQDILYAPSNLWIDWLLDQMKDSGPSGGR